MSRIHLVAVVVVAAAIAVTVGRGPGVGGPGVGGPDRSSRAAAVTRTSATSAVPGTPASRPSRRGAAPPASPRPRDSLDPPPAVALAAAEHRAALITAEDQWSAAEQAGTAEAWELAADAYAVAVAVCGGGPPCVEHAYAEALARANAVRIEDAEVPPGDAPVPLPPRVEAMIDAMDRYVELAPGSEEVPGMRFLAARARWRYRHLDDDTIRRLETLAAAGDGVEVTEYAINLLLDTYIRSGRQNDLRRTVDRLLADPSRLTRFPDTLERLRAIRAEL